MQPSNIAIIGIATLLPQATSRDAFWRRIVEKADTLREVPRDRWDWRSYFDANVGAPDKTNSKWGSFLDPIRFDPVTLGLPPTSLDSIEPAQLLAVETARRALADAGYERREFDRANTSVILAASGPGQLRNAYHLRAESAGAQQPSPHAGSSLPEVNSESFAGTLTNVTAGRVANRFNLGGVNYVIDAACASSLAAISAAVDELESGRSAMVLAGGVDTYQSPIDFLLFGKTQALSPSGRLAPFDKHANGTVLGEGAAIVLLKRLEDAERDSDRIYAVIRGVAGASDGKATGVTAPSTAGQARALARAYQKAGFGIETVEFIEAHATGTPAGDQAELEAITNVLRSAGASARQCALGSVKAQLGHTKWAAGAVGLVKVVLALFHQVRPGQAVTDDLISEFNEPDCPVFVPSQATPWFRENDGPRRAAVSAFGFGGTNYHAVLEEYQRSSPTNQQPGIRVHQAAPGGNHWPAELFVFRGADRAQLGVALNTFREKVVDHSANSLTELAYDAATAWEQSVEIDSRLALVASDRRELLDALENSAKFLADGNGEGSVPGAFFGQGPRAKLAFLFPGQGAQSVDMLREQAMYCEELRVALEEANKIAAPELNARLEDFIFPQRNIGEEESSQWSKTLRDTQLTQLCMASFGIGLTDWLTRLGVTPDVVGGHSFGEMCGLYAAGCFSRRGLLTSACVRGGTLKQLASRAGSGSMAAVAAERARLTEFLPGDGEVSLASHNGPRQAVISGPVGPLNSVVERMQEAGLAVVPLEVCAAFHHRVMNAAYDTELPLYERWLRQPPNLPVVSSLDGQLYPEAVAEVRSRLAQTTARTVEFVALVETMRKIGVQFFLEVGPGQTLTKLVEKSTRRDSVTIASLDGRPQGIRGTLAALAQIAVKGISLRPTRLFDGRVQAAPGAVKIRLPHEGQGDWEMTGGWVRRRGAAQELAREGNEGMQAPQSKQPGELTAASDLQALADAVGEHQQTMRAFLTVHDAVMQRLLGQDAGNPVSREAAQVQVAHAASPPPQSTIATDSSASGEDEGLLPEPQSLTNGQLEERLLALVSECTGYPESMLNVEQDLEAELGIDSLKRVEIITGLKAVLPSEDWDPVKSKLNELRRVRSLRAIATRVHEWLGAPSHDEQTTESIYRGVISPFTHPVVPADEEQLAAQLNDRLILVTGEMSELGDAVSSQLMKLGAIPRLVPDAVLLDTARLPTWLDEQRAACGAFGGIIHLAGWDQDDLSDGLQGWKSQTARSVKSLFQLVQQCHDDLRPEPPKQASIVAVSGLGGMFGRNKPQRWGSMASAANLGLLNVVRKEMPGVSAKCVDLEREAEVARLAIRVVEEFCAEDGIAEVGYCDGQRVTFQLQAGRFSDSATSSADPEKLDVLLFTGGARGIGAEVARYFARQDRHLVLVGRTNLDQEERFTAEIEEPADLRAALIETLSTGGSKPTAREVETRMRAILAAREVRGNLARLRASGAAVEYVSADLCIEAQARRVFEEVYERHGAIDAVFHAVGALEDAWIADKQLDSFERVFDTKADSAFFLSKYLRPESLRHLLFFSSVAGRFGNTGQADYAAANELLNRIAWRLDAEWPKTRVASINWGPWSGVGMAAKPQLEEKFRKLGVALVSAAEGCQFVADEITHGAKGQVEIIAGNGPWVGEHEVENKRSKAA